MIAAWLSLAHRQAPACAGDDTGECACHLPLGPYVDLEGRAYEVEWVACVGHRWLMLPYCIKCNHRFAEPQTGRICCVCLGKMYGRCEECRQANYAPATDTVCETCRDFAELLANSTSSEVYNHIRARRKAKQNQQLVK